jgi:hypothetical protein
MKVDEKVLTYNHVLVVPNDPRPRMLFAAEILSWIIAALMTASALLTLFLNDLYKAETDWAREAFRGGEAVTLSLAVPLLVGALIFVRRGSVRAQPVWIAMLIYALYNYSYAVFGTTFNDAFLVHIGLFSAAFFALACALPALEYPRIADAFAPNRAARGVGIFLVFVGVAQGALWLFVVIRNVVNGEVLHDIPVAGQHLVFALDLALLVPTLILSGIMLARRKPFGYLMGTAAALFGTVYQINLMVAGVVQHDANVAGVKAFAPESLLLTTAFVIAALLMLFGGRRRAASLR